MSTTFRTRRLVIVIALALLASACSGSDSGSIQAQEAEVPATAVAETTNDEPGTVDEPETTAEQEPIAEPEPIEGPGSVVEPDGTEGVVDNGYLAASEVDAYVAGYLEARDESSITFGADPSAPITSVDLGSELTLLSGDDAVVLTYIFGDDFEGTAAFVGGTQWTLVDPDSIEMIAVPSELDPESDGSLLDTSFEAVNVQDPSQTMTVRVAIDVRVIGAGTSEVEVIDGYATIRGDLGTDTYVQISDLIAEHPEVDTLVLTSIGGSVNDEINVHTARLIRNAGMTTWLPANGDISSGGVDLFVSGAERIIEPGGFVGVHSWGAPGLDIAAAELPRDDPAHRSQLEYFSEMMGDQAGPEFYFFTLNAAPFEGIHRMSAAEIEQFGLVTGEVAQALPSSLVGPPAGYLSNAALGGSLKLSVIGCESPDLGDIKATFVSDELGEIQLSALDGAGELVFSSPELAEVLKPGAVSDLILIDGQVTGDVALDWSAFGVFDGVATGLEFVCAQ